MSLQADVISYPQRMAHNVFMFIIPDDIKSNFSKKQNYECLFQGRSKLHSIDNINMVDEK